MTSVFCAAFSDLEVLLKNKAHDAFSYSIFESQ